MYATRGTYQWSFVTQLFHNGHPSHCGDRKTFEVMTSTKLRGTLGSLASLLGATLSHGNHDTNHTPYVGAARMLLHKHIYGINMPCLHH